MVDSEVSPIRGNNEEPLVTGKNRNAQHIFPVYPNLSDTLLNFSSQLNQTKLHFQNFQNIYTYGIEPSSFSAKLCPNSHFNFPFRTSKIVNFILYP